MKVMFRIGFEKCPNQRSGHINSYTKYTVHSFDKTVLVELS